MEEIKTKKQLREFLASASSAADVALKVLRIYAFASAYQSGAKALHLKDIERECERGRAFSCALAYEEEAEELYIIKGGRICFIDLKDGESVADITNAMDAEDAPY